MTPLDVAAGVYLDRQRGGMPQGRWVDGHWYPDEAERQSCCAAIKPPGTRETLLKHCRTALHVANRFGVSRTELLRAAQRARGLPLHFRTPTVDHMNTAAPERGPK